MTMIAYLLAAAAISWAGMLLIGLGAFFFVTLATLIGTLKMVGIVAWSWPWAMLPLWGIVGGAVAKLRRAASRRAARRRTGREAARPAHILAQNAPR
jgi:hypothetical protein